MKKYFALGILFFIIIVGGAVMLINVLASNNVTHEDYVTDETTAIKIAEAIWLPIYGNSIYDKQPFNAKYVEKDNSWIVEGTLPPNILGGVPEIKINRTTGEILYVRHGK